MADWSHDESAVGSHLWNTAGEVVARLGPVLCDVRSEEFLETGQRAGGEHLCAQWILLKLEEVGLIMSVNICAFRASIGIVWRTYSKVAIRSLSSSQRSADLGGRSLDRGLDAVLFEFDGHREGIDLG